MEDNSFSDALSDTQPMVRVEHAPSNKFRWIKTAGVIILISATLGGVAYFASRNAQPDSVPVIRFREVEKSQAIAIDDFSALKFSSRDGISKPLSRLSDSPFTVLVITRGWNENLCLYCVAQTAQWAGQLEKLKKLDAQLLLIFPVATASDADKLELLHQRVKQDGAEIDFPTMLDIDLESVDQLGIRAQLSKPATYIIDQNGKVRFAYVGQSIADRPSVESVFAQLKNLKSQHD